MAGHNPTALPIPRTPRPTEPIPYTLTEAALALPAAPEPTTDRTHDLATYLAALTANPYIPEDDPIGSAADEAEAAARQLLADLEAVDYDRLSEWDVVELIGRTQAVLADLIDTAGGGC